MRGLLATSIVSVVTTIGGDAAGARLSAGGASTDGVATVRPAFGVGEGPTFDDGLGVSCDLQATRIAPMATVTPMQLFELERFTKVPS